MSSPRRKPAELAALLSRKASDDATAVREFAGNPEIIGFHAQQAVEKWWKALMASCGLAQQRTHDIDQLAMELEASGVALPLPRSSLAELTAFAVPLRYEQLLDAEPLDRQAAIAMVDGVGEWAVGQLHSC